MLTRLVLPALVATLLAAGPAGAQMARTEAPAAPSAKRPLRWLAPS